MAEEAKNDDATDVKKIDKKERKITYRFGSKKLNLFRPSVGYPTADQAKKKPDADLKLSYSFGYSGAPAESRQNLYVSNDGKYLVYYIAAVVIVMNIENGTQRFFTAHNDDITALTLDTRDGSSKVASGQTDPIDRPGEGKDLPKVWVWDLAKLSKIELIDKVCWGYISKIQWSAKTGYIYVLCGDESQTLRVFDPKKFKSDFKKIAKKKKAAKGKKQKKPKNKKEKEKAEACNYVPLLDASTMKERISGFMYNPKPTGKNVDEIVTFGKRKFTYIEITEDGKDKKGNLKLKSKTKAISIGKLNKKGEKAFNCGTFLNDGYYAIGSSTGNIYIAKGAEAICMVSQAHSKSIGVMLYDGTNVVTGGFDGKLRRFEVSDKLDKCKGKKGKAVGLKRIQSDDIEVKDSDMNFLPKAIALNSSSKTIFVGTKTNQIVKIGEEKDDVSIVVDGHDGQVWGLCTHPEKDLFFTGGYDNAVKLWDANTRKCLQTHEFTDGDEKKGKKKTGKEVVTCAWSNDGKCIIVGTEDSNIAVFSFNDEDNTFKYCKMIKIPKKNKNAEEENVSYIRFSNNSKYVAVCHMDSNVYVYSVKTDADDATKISLDKWKPLNVGAAPTHVQWSEDGKMIKTLGRDYEIGYFKLNYKKKTLKREPNQPDPDDIKWADDPLVAGWDVQGLYQPGFDGTDLNDATLTSDGKYIISGDDYGTIRLHNYPAIKPSACKEYGGHAEFVVGVELLRSDKMLISCGGADMAIFQWKLTKPDGGDDDDTKNDD